MSAAPDNLGRIGPEWCGRTVVTFNGQLDTHIETGEDYPTRSLAELFTLEPGDKPKSEGLAFIPSTYADFDARKHERQRAAGSFVALTGDVDCDDHPLAKIESLVRGFAGESAWLIYSSAHARPGDMRWRVIIPLERALSYEHWHDAQNAFFAFMEEHGVTVDHALDRAGQPVYLPNVPATHGKTGEALRGEDGAPLYYARSTSGTNAPGLKVNTGPIAVGVAAIRKQREADERERERIRKEAEERRSKSPPREGAPVMEEFNRGNSIETLLELYGYERSPRHSEDWRSPHQTGESYATRVMGDFWVSLSGSDVGARLGQTCKAGCFGDAYDLFVHYEHGGDHKAAFRSLYAERRANTPMQHGEPPPAQADDPGPEPEDFGEVEEHDLEPDLGVPEGPVEPIQTVDAFDFDEVAIPPRPWIIPGVLLSGYTHMLVAPGGSGKSLFTLQLAITLATGETWGEWRPRKPCRTLVINVEDDLDEQRRRLAAARRIMSQDLPALRGMIALAQDPESIIVARADPNRKTVVATPIVDALRRYIQDNDIGTLIVDPFAETFEGDENSNSEVKWAMKIWRDQIARPTGCAVYLVHHTTKGAENGAGNADITRGAGAIVNSTRITATLMPMSTADAEQLGIDPPERHKYVRYDDAKANQSLKSGHARWFEKVGVFLDNATEELPADEVGALRPWTPPTAFDGITVSHLKRVQDAVGKGQWRENQQATEWVGNAVADVLMLDAGDPRDRKRILALLRGWIANDALRVVEGEDEKRNKRKFVEVGKWVTE